MGVEWSEVTGQLGTELQEEASHRVAANHWATGNPQVVVSHPLGE